MRGSFVCCEEESSSLAAGRRDSEWVQVGRTSGIVHAGRSVLVPFPRASQSGRPEAHLRGWAGQPGKDGCCCCCCCWGENRQISVGREGQLRISLLVEPAGRGAEGRPLRSFPCMHTAKSSATAGQVPTLSTRPEVLSSPFGTRLLSIGKLWRTFGSHSEGCFGLPIDPVRRTLIMSKTGSSFSLMAGLHRVSSRVGCWNKLWLPCPSVRCLSSHSSASLGKCPGSGSGSGR